MTEMDRNLSFQVITLKADLLSFLLIVRSLQIGINLFRPNSISHRDPVTNKNYCMNLYHVKADESDHILMTKLPDISDHEIHPQTS
jgi:hypothetical protein